MYDQKSGLNFLQRIGVNQVIASPVPQLDPTKLAVHSLSLQRPLPLPELQADLNGVPPPDRGVTEPWPYPESS